MDIRSAVTSAFWQVFYSLQAIGLVPPVVYFALLAKTAKSNQATAEDKAAVRKWIKGMIIKFIVMWIAITAIMYVLQIGLGVKIAP